MVRRCPVETYLRMGKVANELKGTEKRIDNWIELLRKEEFREFECAKDITALLGQFEHLAELYLNNTQTDLDERELDSVLAIDCDFDILAAALGFTKQIITNLNNDEDVVKQLGHYTFENDFFEPLDKILITTKSIKVISKKFVSRIEGCVKDSMAIIPKINNDICYLVNQSAKLINFSVSFAQNITDYINNVRANNETFIFSNMINYVNDASQSLNLKEATGGWRHVLEFINAFNESINDILQMTFEPESIVTLIGEEPWLMRVEEIKANTIHNEESERKVNKLTSDVKELIKELTFKDQTLQESSVKIEIMEKKLDTVKKQTEVLESMDDEVNRLKRQEKALNDAIEVLQSDLNNVEQENDRLKQNSIPIDQQQGINNNTINNSNSIENLIGNEGNYEKSTLLERIENLISIVKYLRSENSYLKCQDNLTLLQNLKPLSINDRSQTPDLVLDDDESSSSDSDNGQNEGKSLISNNPHMIEMEKRKLSYELIDNLASKKVVDLTLIDNQKVWQKSKFKPENQILLSENETKTLCKKVQSFLQDNR